MFYRRYTKGAPFLSKTVCERVRLWSYGAEPPNSDVLEEYLIEL